KLVYTAGRCRFREIKLRVSGVGFGPSRNPTRRIPPPWRPSTTVHPIVVWAKYGGAGSGADAQVRGTLRWRAANRFIAKQPDLPAGCRPWGRLQDFFPAEQCIGL